MKMTNEIPSWQAAQKALQDVFRLPGFREGQEEIVRDVLSGHDTLAVMPTGSGKSLCYQLPGVVLPGLALVISPLIALMKDQVDSLVSKGIRAVNLNSALSFAEQQCVCDDVLSGQVKFLFVAPERVRNASFQALLRRVPIGLLAVDEAHCISQWGHDFRPDYRRLGALRTELGMPVTIALTATASPEVQRDIVEQLSLRTPKTHILGFDRLNLRFGVQKMKTENEKLEFALEFVRQRIQQRCGFKRQYPGCGILYASTIKQAEAAGAFLRKHGIRAGVYHANLSPGMRSRIQEQFMNDEFHCLIATTAFGMGVDKPDIRYVLHLSMSSSVEAYTQESGRAGRDRKPAECLMLYSGRDVKIQEYFIENGYPDLPIYRTIFDAFAEASEQNTPQPGTRLSIESLQNLFEKSEFNQLDTALRKLRACDLLDIASDNSVIWRQVPEANILKKLAEESRIQRKAAKQQLFSLTKYVFEDNCRTKFILKYFGSREAREFKRCHHCDLCHAMPIRPEQGEPGLFPPEPLHFVLLKYLSTAARCQNARLPVNSRQLAGILTGSTGEPAFSGISTFGLMGYMDPAEICVLTGVLHDSGIIVQNSLGYIRLSEDGKKFLSAKSLRDFPPTIQEYMQLRFPHAPKTGKAWQA
ncbi:MAG: ATP-dependent DNA helicase RecQ [Proteobacteria bacterium]|nr:ATP-dependent DNA helicase RecQ [Pseudomonadota bacterium]